MPLVLFARSLWSHQTLTFTPRLPASLPVVVTHCTQALVTPKHRSCLSSFKGIPVETHQFLDHGVHMAPAAPPLPPQAQPQPLAQPAVGPCTYQEHYSHAANDPWRGNYATLMAQYMTIPPAITPELLLMRMLVYHHGASTPQAFIMLMTPDPAQAICIFLMHWLTQFLVSVPATLWEEMVMAFEGGRRSDLHDS